MKTTSLALSVAFSLCASAAFAERPMHDGKVLLFGNLHAHSKLSDDITSGGNDLLPSKAFPYAHSHGLDFLAISDHHKATDSNNRLFMTPTEYRTKLLDVATAYNAAHPGEFVAIPGIEWGNTATGNHVNVLGATSLPPDSILDADYDDLFAWAKTNAEFGRAGWRGLCSAWSRGPLLPARLPGPVSGRVTWCSLCQVLFSGRRSRQNDGRIRKSQGPDESCRLTCGERGPGL